MTPREGYPGGYCSGLCRLDTHNCATGGTCEDLSVYGVTNVGYCFKSCTSSSQCRAQYSCIAAGVCD